MQRRRRWLRPGSALAVLVALSAAAVAVAWPAGNGWRYRCQYPEEAARGALAVKRGCTETRLTPAGVTLFEDTYRYACVVDGSLCEGTITVNHQPVGASSFTFPTRARCVWTPPG